MTDAQDELQEAIKDLIAIAEALETWCAHGEINIPDRPKMARQLRCLIFSAQKTAWQTIDTAPRDGTYIIGYWPASVKQQVSETWFDGKSFYHPNNGACGKIKYWKPLGDLPSMPVG